MAQNSMYGTRILVEYCVFRSYRRDSKGIYQHLEVDAGEVVSL